MSNNHNNIRRLAHRAVEELRATRMIAGETSWPEALNTFRAKLDIQVMSRNGFKEPPAVKRRLLCKHETVLKYLEARFGDYYASYDYDAPLPESNPNLEGKIWMCWWQGEENAPEIVRACIDSVRRNAGDREVIVITDENMFDYVHIPDWVLEKVKEGIITRTNLSDLLRLSLLAEHGGMWLDATFYCTAPFEDLVFSHPMWSIKRPDYLHASIASGYFAGYSLACDVSMRRCFATARDFFLEYWRHSEFMVDYLLVDYLIVLTQRYDSAIAEAFASIEPNNPRCDDLQPRLGEVYSQDEWQELCRDTCLFKLTWKENFPREVRGKKSYYGAVADGRL